MKSRKHRVKGHRGWDGWPQKHDLPLSHQNDFSSNLLALKSTSINMTWPPSLPLWAFSTTGRALFHRRTDATHTRALGTAKYNEQDNTSRNHMSACSWYPSYRNMYWIVFSRVLRISPGPRHQSAGPAQGPATVIPDSRGNLTFYTHSFVVYEIRFILNASWSSLAPCRVRNGHVSGVGTREFAD